ncbi:hypothetical protein FQN54_004367 [Arachnomyces sp. PD_36]|nr:hypothetical protein FQN54_004367 [Arachnomyces sp. PD_36]
MSLLSNHLEQISLSANAISDLPFHPPKIFANALLQPHDITALIRDTEAHERSLFSLDPNPSSTRSSQRRATRRGTMFPGEHGTESMKSRIYSAKNTRNQSAVARVLGGDMMEEIKKSSGSASSRIPRGEINVEVLLKGAEKFPVAGAKEKIYSLRSRHMQIVESTERLQARVAEQSAQLERMNHSQSYASDGEEMSAEVSQPESTNVTDEDLEREMEEIRELEKKKRQLEARVSGMERDLGGLMR